MGCAGLADIHARCFHQCTLSTARSRQPLLRNRLNYWTPVFLLIVHQRHLDIQWQGRLPGNPIRLAAVVMATFIVVTHDPPDLREVRNAC